MIKNIVFDMGNVLLDYNPEVPLDAFCKTEEEKAVIRKELFGGPEWIQGDLGNMTNEERYESVKQRVPEAVYPALKKCVYEWDICMKPIPGAMEFCEYIRQKGYGLYVLSNASDAFYDYFPKFAPLDFFDGIVVSADIHIIKPDIRIYQHLLEIYHLVPKECLFIDDREDNVEGAKQVGMSGEVFRNDYDAIKSKYQL